MPVDFAAGAVPAIAMLGVCVLVLAALHDVAFRTIPNTACIAVAACGLLLRLHDGTLAAAGIVACAVAAVAGACWALGFLGGGDMKLLGAVALFVRPDAAPAAILAIGLAGGLLGLVYIAARRIVARPAGRPASLAGRILRAERFRLHRGGPLPYGVGIAAGTLIVFIGGWPW